MSGFWFRVFTFAAVVWGVVAMLSGLVVIACHQEPGRLWLPSLMVIVNTALAVLYRRPAA